MIIISLIALAVGAVVAIRVADAKLPAVTGGTPTVARRVACLLAGAAGALALLEAYLAIHDLADGAPTLIVASRLESIAAQSGTLLGLAAVVQALAMRTTGD